MESTFLEFEQIVGAGINILLSISDGLGVYLLFLGLACKQLYFPPGNGINRRNESTKTEKVFFLSTDALNEANCEEHPRSNLAQNSNVPRSQGDYITQVSEEIEGRVPKKLPKEFIRKKNRILGALARLEDFLMNSLLQRQSGTTPETSWNASRTSQRTIEDDSRSDPHPEAGIFNNQTTRNSGSEDGHDRATGVQKESIRARQKTMRQTWRAVFQKRILGKNENRSIPW